MFFGSRRPRNECTVSVCLCDAARFQMAFVLKTIRLAFTSSRVATGEALAVRRVSVMGGCAGLGTWLVSDGKTLESRCKWYLVVFVVKYTSSG